MTFNNGHPAPPTYPKEHRVVCCTRCRRGMPGMLGPCGYALNCPNGCHRPHFGQRTGVRAVEGEP